MWRNTRRWTWRAASRSGGCEGVIGLHKTDMGEGQPVLRSKDPAGVMQEMGALFGGSRVRNRPDRINPR